MQEDNNLRIFHISQWEFKPVWPTNNFHKSWGMEKIRKVFFFQKKLYNKMCHDTKRIFQYIFFQNRPWGTPKAPENNFFFTLTEDR